MTQLYALGIGIGTKSAQGDWLEVFYPAPLLDPDESLVEAIAGFCSFGHTGGNRELSQTDISELAILLNESGEKTQATCLKNMVDSAGSIVICALAENTAPGDVPASYLKLHLLSHRLVKPHETNIDGIFGVLVNLAWTSEGAIALDELTERQLLARQRGHTIVVHSVDKFPRMTDYVMPSGVRIGDASRVRLGAYLGEGTTVMHEGFVNFNAGTEGPNMIEGRISAGVFVGAGTDFGGGCSAMGTLSGGGNIIISVGKDCLIGANAGIGISLGDRCTIEAGLYVTAGTKVQLLDDSGQAAGTVKASQLSGQPNLLYRRNSVTGAVECLTHRSAVKLNDELHRHN